MHQSWRLAAAILLLCAGQTVSAGFDLPPTPTVYPNDYPVGVAFFFPSGSPLERFTGRPGAWYAIYRLPMYPGRPYELLLGHDGDPARMKAYAMDGHPFGGVSVKFEIPLRKVAVSRAGADQVYAATLAIPVDAAQYGVYLLLEWDPPAGDNKPIPVMLQTLAMDEGPYATPGWWVQPKRELESPLQSQQRKTPLVVPVPRGQAPDMYRPLGY